MNYYFKCKYTKGNISKVTEEQGTWLCRYIIRIVSAILDPNCQVKFCIDDYWFNIEHLRKVLK